LVSRCEERASASSRRLSASRRAASARDEAEEARESGLGLLNLLAEGVAHPGERIVQRPELVAAVGLQLHLQVPARHRVGLPRELPERDDGVAPDGHPDERQTHDRQQYESEDIRGHGVAQRVGLAGGRVNDDHPVGRLHRRVPHERPAVHLGEPGVPGETLLDGGAIRAAVVGREEFAIVGVREVVPRRVEDDRVAAFDAPGQRPGALLDVHHVDDLLVRLVGNRRDHRDDREVHDRNLERFRDVNAGVPVERRRVGGERRALFARTHPGQLVARTRHDGPLSGVVVVNCDDTFGNVAVVYQPVQVFPDAVGVTAPKRRVSGGYLRLGLHAREPRVEGFGPRVRQRRQLLLYVTPNLLGGLGLHQRADRDRYRDDRHQRDSEFERVAPSYLLQNWPSLSHFGSSRKGISIRGK
jgi:hypothetical protein